jgi:uncharacterized membrane protein/thiol-disulfide isomerase/thioredoxin
MQKILIILISILLMAGFVLTPFPAQAQTPTGPVVRAVLFYSPTCGHCEYVINEVLLPMLQTYEDQLVVLGVDVSQAGGGQLFGSALDYFQLPPERGVVPTLIIDETILQGSADIPEQFPGLVSAALEAGGNDWPSFPGMAEALPVEQPEDASPAPDGDNGESSPAPTAARESPTVEPAEAGSSAAPATPIPPQTAASGGPLDIREGVSEAPSDPVGFALGGLILIGLVGSFGMTTRWLGRARRRLPNLRLSGDILIGYAQNVWILIFSLGGLGVSSYLAYVEVNQIEAVCGPVGACNIVQSSAYAQILGIPIAVLGLAFYLGVIALWLTLRTGLPHPTRQLAALGLLALALAGTLFSIYLTGLELFVIHAICLWCLTSAVLTASLLGVLGRPLRRLD